MFDGVNAAVVSDAHLAARNSKQMLRKLLRIKRGALARAAVAGLADDAQDMLTSLVSMYDLMVALPNVNAAPIDEHMYDQ